MSLAPAGTPREIVNRISAETAKAIASADLATRFERLGIVPGGEFVDGGQTGNAAIFDLLEGQHARIASFLAEPDESLLALRFAQQPS